MKKYILPLMLILSACTIPRNNDLKSENALLKKKVDSLSSMAERMKIIADSTLIIARQQQEIADKQRKEYFDLRKIADSIRIIAKQNAQEADRLRIRAVQQQHKADSTAMIAFRFHTEAVSQVKIARQQREIAEQQAQMAKKEHQKVLALQKELAGKNRR